MKYTLIQLKDYSVIVSDEKPKQGQYYFYTDDDGYEQIFHWKIGFDDNTADKGLKLVALSLINSFEDIPTFDLPDCIEDVKRLAGDYYKNNRFSSSQIASPDSFTDGYNKSKETYKYTEKDIRKAWNYAGDFFDENKDSDGCLKMTFDAFLKDLSKPKEYEVELEMEFKIEDTGFDIAGLINGSLNQGHNDSNYKQSLGKIYFPKITDNKVTITKIVNQ